MDAPSDDSELVMEILKGEPVEVLEALPVAQPSIEQNRLSRIMQVLNTSLSHRGDIV